MHPCPPLLCSCCNEIIFLLFQDTHLSRKPPIDSGGREYFTASLRGELDFLGFRILYLASSTYLINFSVFLNSTLLLKYKPSKAVNYCQILDMRKAQ